MTNSQRLAAVRELLRTWFLERDEQDAWSVSESILIREGFYCGRKFRFSGYRAVWFVEEEQIKIYDPAGELLESLSTTELEPPADIVKLPALHEPGEADKATDQPIRRAA